MAGSIIGIRSLAEAATFLATDFQDFGGMNNMSLYRKINFPGGVSAIKSPYTLAVSQPGYTDAYVDLYDTSPTGQVGGGLTNPVYRISAANMTGQGNMTAVQAGGTMAFVMIARSDTGLTEFQNRPFARAWGSITDPPLLIADQPNVNNIKDKRADDLNMATGSMIVLDSLWRRAWWSGGEGDSGVPDDLSALRYVGLTRVDGGSAELGGNRIVPGTKLQLLYAEPAVPLRS